MLKILINKARLLYGEVTPCKGSWRKSILDPGNGIVYLWINDTNGSTHIIKGNNNENN